MWTLKLITATLYLTVYTFFSGSWTCVKETAPSSSQEAMMVYVLSQHKTATILIEDNWALYSNSIIFSNEACFVHWPVRKRTWSDWTSLLNLWQSYVLFHQIAHSPCECIDLERQHVECSGLHQLASYRDFMMQPILAVMWPRSWSTGNTLRL
jgi:hypothetical protein